MRFGFEIIYIKIVCQKMSVPGDVSEDLVIRILNQIEKTKTTNCTDMTTVKFILIKVYFKLNN